MVQIDSKGEPNNVGCFTVERKTVVCRILMDFEGLIDCKQP